MRALSMIFGPSPAAHRQRAPNVQQKLLGAARAAIPRTRALCPYSIGTRGETPVSTGTESEINMHTLTSDHDCSPCKQRAATEKTQCLHAPMLKMCLVLLEALL